jgi:hypothetical protein
MKKILSIITLMLATMLSFGQMLYPTNFTVESKATKKVSTMPNIKSAAPFWTEDFSNGIPSTWTNSTAPWEYRGSGTSPGVNTGSQGAVELVHVEGMPLEKSSVQKGAADFMLGIVLTFLVALLSTVKLVG